VRVRLEGEVDRALAGGFPSMLRIADLSYALQVVQESMRLFPPTWIFIRMAAGRDSLPSGADVPAGAKIYLSPWVTHRDSRHFPDPERFDPDRFTFENERAQPRIAYFPFGAGSHLCIGEQLARLEMTLAVAAITAQFRLEMPDGHEAVPEPAITLAPRGGLPMHVVRRP
jgi:cytochrome P450